ncbi:MAG: hypothetical protein ACI9DO_002165 [Reinekea sp.]|jgi:hypothetical protein
MKNRLMVKDYLPCQLLINIANRLASFFIRFSDDSLIIITVNN